MLLISYDLHKPRQNYADLIAAIEAYGNYAHILESTWLIRTSKTAQQVCDDLRRHIDKDDHIFVTGVQEHNRQGWLPQQMWNWMNGR